MPHCPNCGKDDCVKFNRPQHKLKVHRGTNVVIAKDTLINTGRYLHRRCPRCGCEVSITFSSSHVERCGGCGGPWPKEDNDYEEEDDA